MLTFNFNAVLHSLHALHNRVSSKRVFFFGWFLLVTTGALSKRTPFKLDSSKCRCWLDCVNVFITAFFLAEGLVYIGR